MSCVIFQVPPKIQSKCIEIVQGTDIPEYSVTVDSLLGIDLKFSVSGNTSYTRLSKSIDFYKGNDEIQNFHEVFQFYTDQDLVDDGMSLSINAIGDDVDFGDVIYFIQRCI